MNKAKENLIDLIEQFHALGEEALKDIDADDEDCELNDRMIAVAAKIEKATVAVFGKGINTDFGMIHDVYYHKEGIIKTIQEYNKEEIVNG